MLSEGSSFSTFATAGDFGRTIAGTILCLSSERFHHSHCAALLLSELPLHHTFDSELDVASALVKTSRERDRTLERCYSKPHGAFASCRSHGSA
jgi:hypothetical protein